MFSSTIKGGEIVMIIICRPITSEIRLEFCDQLVRGMSLYTATLIGISTGYMLSSKLLAIGYE